MYDGYVPDIKDVHAPSSPNQPQKEKTNALSLLSNHKGYAKNGCHITEWVNRCQDYSVILKAKDL